MVIPEAEFVSQNGQTPENENTENLLEQLQAKVNARNEQMEEAENTVKDGVWEGDPGDGTDFIPVVDLPIEDQGIVPNYDMFDQPTLPPQMPSAPIYDNVPSVNNAAYDFSDIINGDIWFDIDPNVTPTILRNLYPFASSDNGEYLFWDINSSDDSGEEMDIYITDFRGIELKKVASNLYEFICKITNANSYKEIMPFATQPLPSVFKAYMLFSFAGSSR